jgi:hypothetical protein
VIRGSLEGVQGVLVRKKSFYRLVLSVEMLAQSVSVEIDAADVEPAKAKVSTGIQSRAETSVSGVVNELAQFGARPSVSVLDR